MKKIFLALSLALAVYFFLSRNPVTPELPIWLSHLIDRPMLLALMLAVGHMISSSLAIPGGCTIINLIAGKMFGFGWGVLLIYPLSMISALGGYCVGLKIKNWRPGAVDSLVGA